MSKVKSWCRANAMLVISLLAAVVTAFFVLYASFHEAHEQRMRLQYRAAVLGMELCAYVPFQVGYLYDFHQVALGVEAHTLHSMCFVFLYIFIVKLVAVAVTFVNLFLAVVLCCMGIVGNFVVFVPYLLTILYLFISELYTGNKDAINDWAYTMLSQLYIALPFSMINVLSFETSAFDGQIHYDMLLPLSIFIFLWTNDTGAYCSGSLFGKHKLFPRISPAKSWEGSIGGGIFVLIAAGIIGYIANDGEAHRLSILGWEGLGLVVVFFGTWGDLVESLFKRTLGVKDSGNILPGHGGMLDRFDSSLMAMPAAVVYLYTLTLISA